MKAPGCVTTYPVCRPKVSLSRRQVARTAGGAPDEKKAGEKQPRPRYPILTLPAKESSEEHLQRSQDLPYCTFALLTHASFPAPVSASHFSIATL